MERRLTTQDISWFLDLYKNSQLNLDPPYQRRSVWTRKDKLFFLDTIFKGYPCPAIFIHKEIDGNSGKATYHVVDGKQRLETIITFAESKLSLAKDHSDENLRGKKFRDLEVDYKKKFWNFVVGVDQLDIVEDTIVDEVFDRLNRNSRKLERQELRHAKYDGWFITFAETEAEQSEWKELGLATSARAKRMKDVQFISELIIAMFSEECVGFDQDDIDTYYAEFDAPEEEKPDFITEDFEAEFHRLRDFIVECNEHNNCVNEFARNFMHFYSLWCIARDLYQKFSPREFADKYKEFMSLYVSTNEQIQGPEFTTLYKENSVGANTDKSQRDLRHQALLKFFSE